MEGGFKNEGSLVPSRREKEKTLREKQKNKNGNNFLSLHSFSQLTGAGGASSLMSSSASSTSSSKEPREEAADDAGAKGEFEELEANEPLPLPAKAPELLLPPPPPEEAAKELPLPPRRIGRWSVTDAAA